MTMISDLRTKIRALIEDYSQTDTEDFSYTSSNIFELDEPHATAVSQVLKNGTDITSSATIELDTSTGKVTITLGSGDSWVSGDQIEITYAFNDYSNTEIDEYIRASLVYYSIYAHSEEDFELETDAIVPTPEGKTLDLLALIASIIIRPDWNQYDLPNLRVRYNNRLPKDQKIERLCAQFTFSWGRMDVLEFN